MVLVVPGGIDWLYDWSQDQYFLSESDGRVAIFRGIDQDVRLTLSHLEERTTLGVADLPDFNQDQVADGIAADNLADAEAKVAALRELAEDCAQGGRSADACEGVPEEPATTPPTTRPGPGGGAGGDGGGGWWRRWCRRGWWRRRCRRRWRWSRRRRWRGRGRCRMTSSVAEQPPAWSRASGGAPSCSCCWWRCWSASARTCRSGVGYTGDVPSDISLVAGGFVLLAVVAHVAVRLLAPYADPVLLPLVVMLNGLGLAMIYRLDLDLTEGVAGNGWPTQQVVWTLRRRRRVRGRAGRDPRPPAAAEPTPTRSGWLALLLLLLPLVPGIGANINGARIWIRVGPFSFQPGEIAKICLVVFFAGYLVVKRDALALAGRRFMGIDLPRGRDLGPILAAWLVSLGVLVFQRDLGSSLLFFGLFVVLLYVATERVGWAVVGTLLFLGGAYFSYLTFGHVQDRVDGLARPVQ